MTRIIFCALETFSLIGGLQNFNRRVIRHLGRLSVARSASAAEVFLLRETNEGVPDMAGVNFNAPGQSRTRFVWLVLRNVIRCECLLLGHVNLLPLAFLAKFLRPSLLIVLFVHGDEVWNDPTHRAMRFYEPWLLKCVTRIASVSNYTAQRMADAFSVPKEKFCQFPNAVDVINCALPNFLDGPSVLSVTRMGHGDREKNIDKVLQAVSLILPDIPNLRYNIVGDGEMRPELEMHAKELGIADSVHFYGRVNDDALQQAYENATLFVLPSSKEGFGIVYLEAWQHGLPVICSVKGASSEIVSDGFDGFAVDPDNVSALAERMKLLLGDRSLAQLFGSRGREKVFARYLDTAFADRLEIILKK